MSATLAQVIPDLTPEAEVLDAAAGLGCRWEGVQPGIPGRFAPRLRWQWDPAGTPFPASFSTPVGVTPADLRAYHAEQVLAFS